MVRLIHCDLPNSTCNGSVVLTYALTTVIQCGTPRLFLHDSTTWTSHLFATETGIPGSKLPRWVALHLVPHPTMCIKVGSSITVISRAQTFYGMSAAPANVPYAWNGPNCHGAT